MGNTLDAKQEPDIIEASPTKGFFISMLVRDLSLRDAIGDLVDNSVDSARSIAVNNTYDGIKIEIILSSNEFRITDNCDGIKVSTARRYAFRFGRPDEFDGIQGSIGQFGIGMKRALFKIGKHIYIKSIASDSRFEMNLDVDEWAKDEKNWDFKFHSYNEKEVNETNVRGTEIKVAILKKDVIEDFKSNNFIKKLALELEFEHLYPLSKGLTIKVNGKDLKRRSLDLLVSKEIKPAYFEYDFDDGVKVRIWAGIGEDILEEGGWYIFGNSRLILGPEQTEISGWTGRQGSDGAPKYHGQYQRFRGYVFFEASNASLLPWNTSKNGVEIDSPKFKYVRQRMIEMMKPVITFLNQMKTEREGEPSEEELYLKNKVNEAIREEITDVRQSTTVYSEVFISPRPIPKPKNNANVKISYSKSKEQVEELKKVLNVSSNQEVGSATFDYVYDAEID